MGRLATLFCSVFFASGGAIGAPDVETISAVLENRIVEQEDGVALVVGVTDPSGHRFSSYGPKSLSSSEPVNRDTVFEIGSITKVFTALLLAEMAERGEVDLDEPIQSLLPATVQVPVFANQPITLRHLSMHSSGLPRVPENMAASNPLNPYADYSADLMYAFLNGYTLSQAPGAKSDYSNLGVGLLGHGLSLSAGLDYEALVRIRILEPLFLTDTAILLAESQRARLAHGHDGLLNPTPGWDIPALAGAGALRSTATDMLGFLDAHIGRVETPLRAAMQTMLKPSQALNGTRMRIALGWVIEGDDSDPVYWHNGMTGGYSAFAGFRPRTETGVVVLANAARSYDDIGFHLLKDEYGLKIARERLEIDSRLFANYIGRYKLLPNLILDIFHRSDVLIVQGTGQAEVPLSAASERVFFNEAVGVEITFKGEDGEAAPEIEVRQAGSTYTAPRID